MKVWRALILLQVLVMAGTAMASDLPRHIIVLCDQSTSMAQPDYGAMSTMDVRLKVYRDELWRLLQEGDERRLYRPDRDIVSIHLFGVRKYRSLRDDYIRLWRTYTPNHRLTWRTLAELAYVGYITGETNYSLVTCAQGLGLAKARIGDDLFGQTFVIVITDGVPTDPRNELASVRHLVGDVDWAVGVRTSLAQRYAFRDYRTVAATNRVSLYAYEVVPIGPPGPLRVERLALSRYRGGRLQGACLLPEAPRSEGYELAGREWRLESAIDGKVLKSGVVDNAAAREIRVTLDGEDARRMQLEPHRIRVTYRYRVQDGYYNSLAYDLSDSAKAAVEIARIWFLIPAPTWFGSDRVTARVVNGVTGIVAMLCLLWVLYVSLARPPLPVLEWEIELNAGNVKRDLGASANDDSFVHVADLVGRDQAKPRPFGGLQSTSVTVKIADEKYGSLVVPKGQLLSLSPGADQDGKLVQRHSYVVTKEARIPIYLHIEGVDDAPEPWQADEAINETVMASLNIHVESGAAGDQLQTVAVTVSIVPAPACLTCVVKRQELRIEHRTNEIIPVADVEVSNRGPIGFGDRKRQCVKPLSATLRVACCDADGAILNTPNPLVLTLKGSDNALLSDQVTIHYLAANDPIVCGIGLDCSLFPNPGSDTLLRYSVLEQRNGVWVPVDTVGGDGPLCVTVTPDTRRAHPGDVGVRSPTAPPDAPCPTVPWRPVADNVAMPVADCADLMVRVRSINIPQPGVTKQTLAILTLSNTAAVGEGFVEFTVADAEIRWLQGSPPRLHNGHSAYFLVDDKPLEQGTVIATLANGEQPRDIEIQPNLDAMAMPLDADATYELTLQMSAQAVQDNTKLRHSITLRARGEFRAYLGEDWFSLDVGTSSIVAAYNNPRLDIPLLPIGKAWEELTHQSLAGADPQFLPSMLLLQEGKCVTDDEFVMINPPLQTLAKNPGHVVPYLKRVIGFEQVPISGAFTYRDASGAEVTGQPLMQDVVAAVYRSLMKYATRSVDATHNGTETIKPQLVITVPNTLTPSQLGRIRQAVTEALPEVRRIEFLSEPIAVACYYTANWAVLNPGKPSQPPGEPAQPPESETILVYDMGAGTLDITLIRVERVATAASTEEGYLDLTTYGQQASATHLRLTVLAELGRFSAGNNLDHIFADLIQESILNDIKNRQRQLRHGHVLTDLVKSEGANGADQLLGNRLSLKESAADAKVRYSVSPDQPVANIQIAGAYGGDLDANSARAVTLQPADIAGCQAINDFIRSNTNSLLRDLFTTMNQYRGTVHIDTVLLSGRAVQFPGIRASIKAAVADWNDPQITVQYPDLQPKVLKPAVALGALEYAISFQRHGAELHSDSLSARYGFMLRRYGQWTYHEILSRSSKAGTDADGKYWTSQAILNIQNCTNIMLVQTYSANPLADWEKGGQSLTMPIASFAPNQFGGAGEVSVTLEIRADHIRVNIGGAQYDKLSLAGNALAEVPGYLDGRWPLS